MSNKRKYHYFYSFRAQEIDTGFTTFGSGDAWSTNPICSYDDIMELMDVARSKVFETEGMECDIVILNFRLFDKPEATNV